MTESEQNLISSYFWSMLREMAWHFQQPVSIEFDIQGSAFVKIGHLSYDGAGNKMHVVLPQAYRFLSQLAAREVALGTFKPRS